MGLRTINGIATLLICIAKIDNNTEKYHSVNFIVESRGATRNRKITRCKTNTKC